MILACVFTRRRAGEADHWAAWPCCQNL